LHLWIQNMKQKLRIYRRILIKHSISLYNCLTWCNDKYVSLFVHFFHIFIDDTATVLFLWLIEMLIINLIIAFLFTYTLYPKSICYFTIERRLSLSSCLSYFISCLSVLYVLCTYGHVPRMFLEIHWKIYKDVQNNCMPCRYISIVCTKMILYVTHSHLSYKDYLL
jgi:hypothetical protein